MRFWELPLHLDPSSPRPLIQQIVEALIDAIRSGMLPPGSPLPGTRTLADQLHVSRGTVVAAFDELMAKGWIDASTGSCSRVADPLPAANNPHAEIAPPSRAFDLPTRPELVTDPTIRVFKLSHGVPDARLMSSELLGRAYSRAIRKRPSEVLDLFDPSWEGELRRELAIHLRERQWILASPDCILPTRGSQHALSLIARGLVKTGERVVLENPGNPRARDLFQQEGAKVVPAPVDEEGLDVDALEQIVKQQPIRLIYVSPRFQVPTTVTLSAERRQRLLALAREHRFAIIEDDSEGEYTLEGRTPPPLASGDGIGSVIYLFSFSRLLAPGIRLGLIAGPQEAVGLLSRVSQKQDTLGDLALERAFATLLKDGEIHRHIMRVRRIYLERRNHLLTRLTELFGNLFTHPVPAGGLSLWLKCDPSLDLPRWYEACSQRSVKLQLGSSFMIDRGTIQALPLAFGAFEPEEMDQILYRMHLALPPKK